MTDGIVPFSEEIWDTLTNNFTVNDFTVLRYQPQQEQGLEIFPGEECDRTCSVDEPSRICYYKWVLESYAAMGS